MLALPTNALFVTHQGQDGGAGLSPRLWGRVTGQMLTPDGQVPGFFVSDDFANHPAAAPAISGTTAGVIGGYGYYVDTATSACSIKQIATASGGVVQWATGATDNHEAWLTAGGNTGVFGAISDTAGSDKLTVFEARFQVGQITNTYNTFIGLAEEGLAAADTVTDAGALASKDLIGFWVLEADGDALNFGYRKAGQSAVTTISGVKALSASTWYKVGFIYDPKEVASKRIKVYVDNVEQSTYVTATNIAAATFPDGEELTFLAGLKNGSAAAHTMNVDWWAFYQER